MVAVGGCRIPGRPGGGRPCACGPAAGIALLDFLRVEDGRYWSYLCADEACCPDGRATPFDSGQLTRPRRPWPGAGHPRCWPTGPRWRPGWRRSDGIAAVSMRQATRRAERHASRACSPRSASPAASAAAPEGHRRRGAERGGHHDRHLPWRRQVRHGLPIRVDHGGAAGPAGQGRCLGPDGPGAGSRAPAAVDRRDQAGAARYVAAPAALLAFVAWQSGDGRLRTFRTTGRSPTSPGTRWPCCSGR